MIDITLIKLLPENISDEAAYHLVNFIGELALELTDHYFTQLMRYEEDNTENNRRNP
jgi:hypothetical protein